MISRRKKVIFISGHHGFIASHLIKQLRSPTLDFVRLDKDVRTLVPQDLEIKASEDQDKIFLHFAGISSVWECEKNKETAIDVNLKGTLQSYLSFSESHPDGVFINFSSSHVYQMTENTTKTSEDSPLEPQSFYGETKLQAERMLSENAKSAKILNLRLFNHTHKSQSPTFFLPSIYSQIHKAKLDGTSCTLDVGDLSLKRDISHVYDLIDALNCLFDFHPESPFQTFNICSGRGKSLHLLVQLLSERMKVPVKISVNPTKVRGNDPREVIGSNDRIRSIISWEPQRSTDEKVLIENFLK